MVYQELALAGNLPIRENIHLGREPGRLSRSLARWLSFPEGPAGGECLRRNRALYPSTVKLLSRLISRLRE